MDVVLFCAGLAIMILAAFLVSWKDREVNDMRAEIDRLHDQVARREAAIRDLLRTRRKETRERFLGLIEEQRGV